MCAILGRPEREGRALPGGEKSRGNSVEEEIGTAGRGKGEQRVRRTCKHAELEPIALYTNLKLMKE